MRYVSMTGFALAACLALAAPAAAKCKEPDVTCKQKIDAAKEKVEQNQAPGVQKELKRVNEVTKALVECLNCATEEFVARVKTVTPNAEMSVAPEPPAPPPTE